jgi:hypothetical protein
MCELPLVRPLADSDFTRGLSATFQIPVEYLYGDQEWSGLGADGALYFKDILTHQEDYLKQWIGRVSRITLYLSRTAKLRKYRHLLQRRYRQCH